jgi:putative transposase
MTWPRRVVPGTTYLLTRRCTQRRFMLVPRGVVPKLFGYCVALAAERHRALRSPWFPCRKYLLA